MNAPQITWYAKTTGSSYESGQEFYAGTYTGEEALAVTLQIWNNRWGVTDVETIQNAALNFFFDTLEDSALLASCAVRVGNYDQMPVIIKDGRATVALNRILSGVRNNGDAASTLNADNFVEIHFEFTSAESRLKISDLKNLYFEVTSLN